MRFKDCAVPDEGGPNYNLKAGGLAVPLSLSHWRDEGASFQEWPWGVSSSQDILRIHKGRLVSRHTFPFLLCNCLP